MEIFEAEILNEDGTKEKVQLREMEIFNGYQLFLIMEFKEGNPLRYAIGNKDGKKWELTGNISQYLPTLKFLILRNL